MPRTTIDAAVLERIRPLVEGVPPEQRPGSVKIGRELHMSDRTVRHYLKHLKAEQAAANGADPAPTSPEPVMVLLDQIRLDGDTQARVRIDATTVQDYADALTEGATFPPVVVFFDGTTHWLADGFHRVQAAHQVGYLTIRAEVRPGGQREALLYACSANATHGLRRTNADKERVVLTLLDDPEWSSWSDREIARHCGVTHPFVGKLRQRFADLSGNDYQMTAPRTVHRGDQTYTLDPSRIGHQATPIHMNGQVGDDRQEDGSSDPPSAPDHQGQRPAVAPDTPRGSVDLCPQKEDGPTSVDTWLKLVREMCSLIDSLAEQGGLTTLAQRWSPASQAELLAELQALTTPLVALQEELQAVCTTVDLHGPGEATM